MDGLSRSLLEALQLCICDLVRCIPRDSLPAVACTVDPFFLAHGGHESYSRRAARHSTNCRCQRGSWIGVSNGFSPGVSILRR